MILNISEAANLAIHALFYLAKHADEQPITSPKVAQALQVSEAHLSKVFQRLVKAGLVTSLRGPRGGFHLARETGAITVLEIYETMDGPLQRGEHCLLTQPVCRPGACMFGGLISGITDQVHETFSQTSLQDLILDRQQCELEARAAAKAAESSEPDPS